MSSLEMVMETLKSKGNEKFLKTYVRHGIPADRTFGVSNADLKLIAKTIKGQQDLAYKLYDTGNMDAMYLAGIVVDGHKMTKDQAEAWAEAAADIPMIEEYIVPWIAVENSSARELAMSWIHSEKEHMACAGWRTYSGIVATAPDDALDLQEIEDLLKSIPAKIDSSGDRLRYVMNGFVISVGAYVKPLNPLAKEIAAQLGKVSVDMGDTACKVPVATDYIAKIEGMGRVGQKRKTMRC